MTVADEHLPREEHLPRDERRRRTEAAILLAARELFAETGFERTTIRGVAARAGIDPALVMQYYGSKEGLFAAAARWTHDSERLMDASLGEIPEAALADLFDFEDGAGREAGIALLRNCLTHPAATSIVRDQVMCDRIAAVAAKVKGSDAELRAALFSACMMGLGLARYLLAMEPLASADRRDVERVFLPALRMLVEPAGASAGDSAGARAGSGE